MALKKCKECGQDVSTTAKACPHCGAKLISYKGCGTALLIMVGLAIVVGTLTGNEDSNQTRSKVTVSADNYGDHWPLTVDSGFLTCTDGQSLVFHHGGKEYAVNGFASSRGYEPIEPIWRIAPSFNELVKATAEIKGISESEVKKAMGTPTRVNTDPLFKAGLPLCD
jgi:RNA polymerase subunit RPABC4/transcription elongation factor Spt4